MGREEIDIGSQPDKEKERLLNRFSRMYDELREWRSEHAGASFDEIAAPVTPRRRAIMGELLEALARQQGSGAVPEGLVCELCGRAMSYKEEPVREVEHYLEGETDLKRASCHCPHCEAGIFPPG